MTDKEKIRKIIDVMETAEWEPTECDYLRRSVCFKKGYMTIEVSFEECACHGGRISIREKGHNHIDYRIEHECYDRENGIVDSETELLWEIDNELLNAAKQFDHYTYKACIINQYGQKDGRDDERNVYCKSLDAAFRAISALGEDPLTFTEGIKHYPNPDCHLKVKRIHKEEQYSWDRNKIWFELEYTADNWKTSRKYEAYLSIFEKK